MKQIDIFPQKILYQKYSFDLKKLYKNIIKKKKKYVSNKGGTQFDITIKDKTFISFLEREANNLTDVLKCQKVSIDNIWLNINKKGDYNVIHDHPSSIVSGIFYIRSPKDSGDLIFTNDYLLRFFPIKPTEFNEYNSQVWKFKPEENTLYLFPSWLKHEVEHNNSNKERISLAFNFN